MKAIIEYVKKHVKQFIIGVALFVFTLGGYGIYKLYKSKGES